MKNFNEIDFKARPYYKILTLQKMRKGKEENIYEKVQQRLIVELEEMNRKVKKMEVEP